jgi:hypothetical protein
MNISMMLDSISQWLETTQFSAYVNGHTWVWPLCETLHFIGLALLIGIVALIDLRMLGLGKSVPFAPLHSLLPWALVGFAINLITGVVFFVGIPSQYVHNVAFWVKMLFIMLTGINVLIFYFTAFGEAEQLGPGDDAPLKAKVIAVCSLVLWIGVMYWGRMLPFIGDAF